MILRRLLSAVRRQDWFTVFVETAIVVLGVFLGLQVNNWNEARETDRRSAEFTERLKVDLKEEYWVYQYVTAYFGEALASAERAARALDGAASLSDEALLVNAYRATQFKVRTRRRATYDELTSTGEIGLIRDQAMRDTAMGVYSTNLFDRITTQGVQSKFREAFRMTIPTDVQRALRAHCGDRPVLRGDFDAIVGSLDYPCALDGVDAAKIAEAAAALRASTDIVPLLRLRIADLETQLTDLKTNNRDILNGLRAVAEEGK